MAMTPLTGTPSRTMSQSAFDSACNDFFSTKLPLFVTEANALQTDVNSKQASAATSASDASGFATAAAGSATAAAGSATAASGSASAAAASAASAVSSPGTQATSSSSIAIGMSSKSLTLNQTGKSFVAGQFVSLCRTSDPSGYWMLGAVTAFTSGTGAMTVNVISVNGSGSFSDWTVAQASPVAAFQGMKAGATLQTCETLSAPEWLPSSGATYLKSSYPALSSIVGNIEDGGTAWTAGSGPSYSAGSGGYGQPLDYLNGLWLLGGYTGSTAEIRTSSDGITFTQRSSGSSSGGSYQAFSYGAGLFVAVGYSGDLRTSPDGTTWANRTSQFGSGAIQGVAFNGSNLFVAAGSGTSHNIATSADGITWTGRGQAMSTGTFKGLAYGAGLFVGVTNASPAEIKTSTDGITWTGRTNPLTGAGVMVRFVNGEFWMASSTNKIARSADGINWTEVTNPLGANQVYSVVYGNGRHVVVGANTTSLAVSDDNGSTWSTRTSGFAGGAIVGVASNGSRFVICGSGKVSYNTPYSYDTATQFVTPNISVTAPVKSYIKA